MSETLFIIGRIALSGYFLIIGINFFRNQTGLATYAERRGLPMPKLGILAAGIMLLLGGLGLFFGVYTEIAIALLVLFLLAAAVGIHHYWSDTDPSIRKREMADFLITLALASALLMALEVPEPWPFSL